MKNPDLQGETGGEYDISRVTCKVNAPMAIALEFNCAVVCLRRNREMPDDEVCIVCSAVLSACESAGTTDPTILPARKVVLALAFDPLDNHEIAFGVARFALHLFS